jgi:hypothetical protein
MCLLALVLLGVTLQRCHFDPPRRAVVLASQARAHFVIVAAAAGLASWGIAAQEGSFRKGWRPPLSCEDAKRRARYDASRALYDTFNRACIGGLAGGRAGQKTSKIVAPSYGPETPPGASGSLCCALWWGERLGISICRPPLPNLTDTSTTLPSHYP